MKTTHLLAVVGLLAIGILVYGLTRTSNETGIVATAAGSLDTYAQCLTDAGATFYGAFWCPHCEDQKSLFADSKNLPYVECSSPDGQEQLEVCTTADITSYPTWRFADGSELKGTQTLADLSSKTNCPLP